MNDADKKLLTEYLGECWHRPDAGSQMIKPHAYIGIPCSCGTVSYNARHASTNNRTFTTRNDTVDLYEAIAKKGKWWEFADYAGNQDTEHSVTEFETILQIFASIASWLFCLNGQGYEERCQMVADWIKEASHEGC